MIFWKCPFGSVTYSTENIDGVPSLAPRGVTRLWKACPCPLSVFLLLLLLSYSAFFCFNLSVFLPAQPPSLHLSHPRALVLVGFSLIILLLSCLWRSQAVLHCGVKVCAKLAFLLCPKNLWWGIGVHQSCSFIPHALVHWQSTTISPNHPYLIIGDAGFFHLAGFACCSASCHSKPWWWQRISVYL